MGGIWARLPVWAGLTSALAAGPVIAQIATDGSVGPEVELQGPDFAIGRDLGMRAGDNLFHSFERFSLRTGQSATFSGPDAIRNVISRVTGGRLSNIDGTIASTMPLADFYFINPAGLLFGPNASLNVPGSFHVSTADQLQFEGGEVFSADRSATSSFSVAAPEAFGFLHHDAGPITIARSALPVAPEETLSLVGGGIVIDGGRIALLDPVTNGNVTLVAMSRPGAVAVADGSTSAAPEGRISITGGIVDVSSAAGGGVVRIRAGELEVGRSIIFANNLAGESGIATALIDIEANSVGLDTSEVGSIAVGAGDAGEVRVRAGELAIRNRTVLRSDTFGDGNAGDVTVSARELQIANGGLISSSTFAGGDAGDVQVRADRLTVHTGEDSTTGIVSEVALQPGAPSGVATGNAGRVTVEANDVTVRDAGMIASRTADVGDADRVELTADRITLRNGGQIVSSTGLQSSGAGGNVVVTARESLSISGQTIERDGDPVPSGVFASTESTSPDAGDAGTAIVTAPLITIADRGEISSETFNSADGGRLRVSAEHLVIDDGEITTQATRAGNGGGVEVAANVIELRNGGLISAESTGSGNAGSLTITAPDRLVLDNRSEISTSAVEAGGGQITIEVDRLIDLRKSSISSSVAQTAGNAGDITIDPDFLVLDDSQILARADAGVGGDISIVADNLVVSPDSLINAEAGEEGIDGTVVTSEPAVDLASALVVLAAPPLDADALLREPCALRRDVGTSSFTGVGRGGLPAAPDRPLGSAYRSAAEGGAAPGTNVRPAALTLAMHCSSTD